MARQLAFGTQIIYIPLHAKGDENHPDAQAGFVTSVRGNTVFCRYWSKKTGQLRTTANSEGCDRQFLIVKDTVPDMRVWQAIRANDIVIGVE